MRCAFAALTVMMGFEIVRAATGVGGAGFTDLANDWVYQAIEFVALGICIARIVRRREQRFAWTLMTVALALWAVGDLIWSAWLEHIPNPPSPSVADVSYLLMYPVMYGALMTLIRSRNGHGGSAQWLDGGVVALAVGAVAAALVFGDVLRTTSGRFVAEAVNLAYPAADFVLLMFVAMGYVLVGRRAGRDWLALGGGVVLMAVADILYAEQSAGGLYVSTAWVNVLYLASFAVIAVTAWLPSAAQPENRSRGRDTMVLTFAAAATALGLLVVAAFTSITPLAVGFAGGALALATIRSALTYRENNRILQAARVHAATDALTGLGNRRQLVTDLEHLFGGAYQAATLLFFDLNGFKRYNDTYGHGAGDALLIRLAVALSAVIGDRGSAYRLGGDEFCVLLGGHYPVHDQLVASAQSALTEGGAGFDVSTSLGVALIPDEAASADAALRLADERMYADKGRTQRTPVRDVLMQVLTERTPGLIDHATGVTAITAGVAVQFGMDAERLDETLRAAELHDIGKLAIPDAILDKPGPLDDSEWAFMEQHPIIGQRILDAADALRPVGALVRASHERWDGRGYPDRLRGEEIPLGARIIAVCDAYDAMVSDRCYQSARSHDDALAELRAHAGTQFDADVVAALEHYFRSVGDSPVALDEPPEALDELDELNEPREALDEPREAFGNAA